MQSAELDQYLIFLSDVVQQRDDGVDELSSIVRADQTQVRELRNRLSDEVVEEVGLEVVGHVLSKETVKNDKRSIETHEDSVLLELVGIQL